MDASNLEEKYKKLATEYSKVNTHFHRISKNRNNKKSFPLNNSAESTSRCIKTCRS